MPAGRDGRPAPATISPVGPIAIIDYGAGNLRSVQKAFERLGYPARFVSSPGELDSAAAVVFPGQGASPQAIAALNARGMADPIRNWIADGKPFFGGLPRPATPPRPLRGRRHPRPRGRARLRQALRAWTEGAAHGLELHRPQGSTSTLRRRAGGELFLLRPLLLRSARRPRPGPRARRTTVFGFASFIARDNVVATQFHPEKSGTAGLMLYDNFVKRLVHKQA